MIAKPPRIVIDTNVLLSALLWPSSVPAQAYKTALHSGDVLLSSSVQDEYYDVFSRPKFDPYASLSARLHFLEEFTNRSLKVAIAETVTICRDPKDNKFLELALNGQADLILTGDDHLLSLHPWRGIPIHNSQGYLALSL